MPFLSTRDSWGSAARLLHWTVAALVFAQIALGVRIALLDMYDPADVAWYKAWVPLHKSLGLTVLLLMLVRLVVRASGTSPVLPTTTPRWQSRLARCVHMSLYVLLIAQPVLGYLQSAAYGAATRFYGLFVVPNVLPAAWMRPQSDTLRVAAQDAHTVVAGLIIVLILMHVAGALKHQFVDRDGVLPRMITGRASR